MPPPSQTVDVRKLCYVLREYQERTSAQPGSTWITLKQLQNNKIISNEKQADILKGQNCFITECPTPQESSQSIGSENQLDGLFMIRASIMKISNYLELYYFHSCFSNVLKCLKTYMITNEFP